MGEPAWRTSRAGTRISRCRRVAIMDWRCARRAGLAVKPGVQGRGWSRSAPRARCCATRWRCRWVRCSTSPPIAVEGQQTLTHRAVLRLRRSHRRAGPRGCRGAGAVRAADRRDHGLSLCRALPVQGPHGGRATRHPRVSAGTVTTMTARTVGGLVGFLGLVRDRIAVADAAQFDETSLRVEGKQRWTQASTGKSTSRRPPATTRSWTACSCARTSKPRAAAEAR